MKSGTSSESLNEVELKRSLTIEINAIKPIVFTENDADDEEEYVFNDSVKITRSIPFQKRYKKDCEGKVNETTALLQKYSPTSSSPNRILNYITAVEIESQHFARREKKRWLRLLFLSIILTLTMLSVIALGFTSQPVQDPHVYDIEIVTRSISLFEFNLDISGLNSNFIPIEFTPDIDVYVSRDISSAELDFTDFIASQELLGHVKKFHDPGALPPLSSSKIASKVSMVDPSNTLGKFIYMTFPFVLTLKGSLTYSTPLNLFQYEIPVCLYQLTEKEEMDSKHFRTEDSFASSTGFEGRQSSVIKFKDPKDLLFSVNQVVKNRIGSVLGRQMILKSDHFEAGVNKLDIHLQGAPNFRMADMNIFGVAQPTVPGIKTVLTLLQCHPGSLNGEHAHWISAREEPMVYLNRKPFIIRDAKFPLRNIDTYHGILTVRLEQMEMRLKEDIIKEQHRWSGLVLVHEERSDSRIVSNWMAIDHIQTPREVFESLKQEGFKITYDRIPISPEQAPEDRYIDEFLQKFMGKSQSVRGPVILNCGMGFGRTTCSMVIAMVIRRAQMLLNKDPDPLPSTRKSIPETQLENEKMMDMIGLLEYAFSGVKNAGSAIEWALLRSPVLGDLKDAMAGKYIIVLQLCSLLQFGVKAKGVLDRAIDRCAILVNLRTIILVHRIRYSISGDKIHLNKAVGFLERYLFLLAMCSYLQEGLHSSEYKPNGCSFEDWMGAKPDVYNILTRLRNTTPPLSLFRPCEDLSVFSTKVGSGLSAWGPNTIQPAAELDKFVIKARTGSVLVQNTILKEDFWFKVKKSPECLKGASNFRKVEGFPVYGVAQPTLQGVKNVLTSIFQNRSNIVWINLREEPFVYINGIPYVLRDTKVTIRNIKSFEGITSSSLEILEKKLKSDVIREIEQYEGKILLHTESKDGQVIPIWEECQPDTVLSLKEAMELVHNEIKQDMSISQDEGHYSSESFSLKYFRVPQTAESNPEAIDLDDLVKIVAGLNLATTSVVLNCQIGMGRSTLGTILISLIMRWMLKSQTGDSINSPSFAQTSFVNYQVIHSLLRVIRNGIECKRVVDRMIDSCGEYLNIRDLIEEHRQQYEIEKNPEAKENARKKGILALRRYFTLVLFQNYLDQNPPTKSIIDLISFKDWLSMHPEFDTIEEELNAKTIDPLVPVDEIEPGDGIAMTNEVIDVVNRRKGAVVSQGTIVKFDLFPGAQKMSLSDRIDGAHNFRTVNIMMLHQESSSESACSIENVTGVGMPTMDGIRAVLNHLHSGPNGSKTVYWTSLREEPVLYIKGRPYVLRLLSNPINNLVATGIANNRVELMEIQMKKDMIFDMQLYNNRVLLHEERVEGSNFLVVPVWETVKEEDIQTPLDIYASIMKEGYNVDYLRIPITDELSPIPDVFNQLVDRILSIPKNCEPVFNCQMGRGRTTQGLVVTYLMKMIVGIKNLSANPDLYFADDEEVDNFCLHSPNTAADGVDATLEKGYKAGQYNLVLQLIAVLQYGKLAKRLTDLAIDACSHMQNLREAIYDYRIRLAALPLDSDKYHMTFQIGCNYLVRYFYLITFADYLIENWAEWKLDLEEKPPILFSNWLLTRREIQNIIKVPNLD